MIYMNKIPFRFYIQFLLLMVWIVTMCFTACQEHSSDFIMGEEFTDSKTSVQLIDTLSVKLSTVILDSVETSGTGSILVGHYQDDVFGGIISHSCFEVGLPSDFDFQVEDQYDSLTLVLLYNGYFFGDTTCQQKIQVYQLTEMISDDDVLTSRTPCEYHPESIGEIVYTPRPMTYTDTLRIRISDVLGLNLFERLINDPEMQENEDLFLSYFPGLALVADEMYEGVITGFYASVESDASLILHTSRQGLTTEKIDYEFGINDINRQFNQIQNDFSSIPLCDLTEQKDELPSTETNNIAYLQGGTGLVIRVDFPSLNEIMLIERGEIAEAILSISPVYNSMVEFALPPDLILYNTNKTNQKVGSVKTSDGTVVSSLLVKDELYHEDTAYSFDVTQYLKSEIEDSYVDPDNGLLIVLPTDNQNATFRRLMVDAEGANTRLDIYYLKY